MGLFQRFIKKSAFILQYNSSGCNGCSLETQVCFSPVFDCENLGIVSVGNPKHADILLVTGCANLKNKNILKNIYDEIPYPKAVVAVGSCACSGGVFKNCKDILGGVENIIPVDVYIPGCSPKPKTIIEGIELAIEKLSERVEEKNDTAND